MDNEKLIEILRDKEFAKKILVMETPEEVQNDPKVIKAYLGERREIDE